MNCRDWGPVITQCTGFMGRDSLGDRREPRLSLPLLLGFSVRFPCGVFFLGLLRPLRTTGLHSARCSAAGQGWGGAGRRFATSEMLALQLCLGIFPEDLLVGPPQCFRWPRCCWKWRCSCSSEVWSSSPLWTPRELDVLADSLTIGDSSSLA